MMKDKAVGIKEQALVDQVKMMIDMVKGDCKKGTGLHEIEKKVFEQLLKMGRQMLGIVFDQCGLGDMGERVSLDDGRQVKRLPEPHTKAYLSIFGSFDVKRYVYGSREGQKIEYIPLDAHLQLPRHKFSYLLQDWDQSLAVESPYQQVSETLERIFGLSVCVHSLERGNRVLSESTQRYWDERVTPPAAEQEQIVVCSADSKGVVIRKSPEEQVAYQREQADKHKPASFETHASKKRSGKKKMAVLGAAYTVEPHVRTPDQILEALFRQPTQPPATDRPKRPKPIAKHIRASMERDKDDTLAPARQQIFDWLAHQQQQRNPCAEQPCVLIMDGEEALWNMGQSCLGDQTHIEILDIIHACSYVWKAVQALYPKQAVKDQIPHVKNYVERILWGEVDGVIRGLKWKATYHNLKGERLKPLEQTCVYFENNASRMRYHAYLAQGYPIATGVIEGACRHVVVDRMEGTGMRWVMAGAQSMLNLRCIHISGQWDEFMAYHIEREQNEIYPAKAANDASFILLPIAA